MALERVGFTIVTFNDPVLALKRFRPNTYGLVILDVMMKKMDGFELYNRIKKRDPGVNICFLTASSEVYCEKLKKEKHCELDKDLFLNMPLPIKELVEEIKRRIG
jgi:DNA-binding response OmpR family regulator